MEYLLVGLAAMIGAALGSIAVGLGSKIVPFKEPESPPAKRPPTYNTPDKGAAYMASAKGPQKMPSTWIKPG